jgi:plastocyanin
MTVLAILLVIAAGIGVNRLLGGGNDGNNDPSPTPKGTKSVSQAEAGITALRMRDRRFHPDGIEMTKGKEFSLSLVNQDDVRHNFHFRAPGDAPFVNIVIQPNKTQGITFRAPGETGEYEFYCTFHKDDGMTGTVVVSG